MVAAAHIWGKCNVMDGVGYIDRFGFCPFATATAAVLEYEDSRTGGAHGKLCFIAASL